MKEKKRGRGGGRHSVGGTDLATSAVKNFIFSSSRSVVDVECFIYNLYPDLTLNII